MNELEEEVKELDLYVARRTYGLSELEPYDAPHTNRLNQLIVTHKAGTRNEEYWDHKAPTFPNFAGKRHFPGTDQVSYYFNPLQVESRQGEWNPDERKKLVDAIQLACSLVEGLTHIPETTRNLAVALIQGGIEAINKQESKQKDEERRGFKGVNSE